MKRSILASFLGVAAGVLTTFTAPTEGATKLRAGYNQWIGLGAVFVAKDKGFFEAKGLDVELTPFAGPADTLPPLSSGSLDLAMTTADCAIIAAASDKTPLKIFYFTDTSAGADAVVAKADIKTAAGLKGKKVASTPGQVNDMLLLLALEKAGLKETDVERQVMSADDAGSAFVAGKVDAAVTWEPWVSTALGSGGHVVFSSNDAPNLILDVMVVTADTLASRKPDLASFAQAVDQAEQFIAKNPAEATAIMAKWLAAKPEDVTSMLKGVKVYGLADNAQLYGSGAAADAPAMAPLTKVGEFLKKHDAIKALPPLADMVDATVIKAASPAAGGK